MNSIRVALAVLSIVREILTLIREQNRLKTKEVIVLITDLKAAAKKAREEKKTDELEKMFQNVLNGTANGSSGQLPKPK